MLCDWAQPRRAKLSHFGDTSLESLYCRFCGARLHHPGGKCDQCGRYTGDPAHDPARQPNLYDDPQMDAFRRRIFQATPKIWMTYVLMGLVGVGYVWQILITHEFLDFSSKGLVDAGSNFGPLTLNGEWWRLLSCIFLHGSLIHFAMNMYCFYSFGPLVERLVGNWGMGVLFVVSGLFGSIASVNWNPDVNSIGASGAVFGVAGGLLGYLLCQRRQLPTALFSELTNSTVTFVVLNIFLAAAIKHIDQAAHIGGLAGGFIIGLIQASDSSPASLAWRPVRNGLVVLLGVVAFVTVTKVHREPRFRLAQVQRGDVVRRDHEAEQGQVVRARTVDINGEISAILQEADRIEEAAHMITSGTESEETDESAPLRMKRDVLEPWQKVREQLDALRSKIKDVSPFMSRLADYYAQREASWIVFVDYFKTLDEKKLTEFETLKAEADRTIKKMKEEAGSKGEKNQP
jgi:membrane associated rhomboid family serine protease